MRILVLGVSGMLGSAAFRLFHDAPGIEAMGTARSARTNRFFPHALAARIIPGIDVENPDTLAGVLREARPDAVLNAVGVVKQLAAAGDPLMAVPINTILPHRLARLAALAGARLIHVSTDCVFTGRKGGYREGDPTDAEDLYGRSKLLGEVDYENAITLRTSIIGRELDSRNGLLEWFLHETGGVKGFRRAIFSGLTTDALSRVIVDHVLPNPALHGVWHVSAAPISKHDLLTLIGQIWEHRIPITSDDAIAVDRSLNSDRFRAATGWTPPDWPTLIADMHRFSQIPE